MRATKEEKAASPPVARADTDTVNRVYTALLGRLALDAGHHADLIRSGFTPDVIERLHYRTWSGQGRAEIIHALAEEFGREVLLGVPGFFVNDRGEWAIACPPALLIPVHDPQGRIVALKARPDEDSKNSGAKYIYLSSAKRGGPGSGSPPHVPLNATLSSEGTARLTQGELNADLATALSGLLTISAPGVGNWRACLPVLKELGVRTVRLAFDADWRRRPTEVALPLRECGVALNTEGYGLEIELWEEAEGKGIDDLLASGKVPRVVVGDEARDVLDEAASGLPEGRSAEQPVARRGAADGRNDKGDQESQVQVLLRLALESGAEFWHTPYLKAFASIPRGGHWENYPVHSSDFKLWLVHEYYRHQGQSPSAESRQAVLNTLEARARFDGPEHPVFTRVAELVDLADPDNPTYYLDLCNDTWQAVAITRDGWEVFDEPPVKFRRAKGVLALPLPERGGSIDDLRPFVNVASEDDWLLVVGWLAATLCPSGPYPILAIQGEQGSAKSTTSRVLRRVIDPHATLLRCAPREVRDLMIAATNSWVLTLDNMSGIPDWLSDALCRLATGGGIGTRTLYENEEETFFDAMRPILLNGIDDVATRGDLLDRCVSLQLPTIPMHLRREEKPFWREFATIHARILGALLDAVVGGLGTLPGVHLAELPRMADFARWGEAVGRALGWPDGAFLEAYNRNQESSTDVALEDSPVAAAVLELLNQDQGRWEGTATDLLGRLGEVVGEKVTKTKRWPQTPQSMSMALRRAGPAFRKQGIDVEFERATSRKRCRTITIQFAQPGEGGGEPSEPSIPSEVSTAMRPRDGEPGLFDLVASDSDGRFMSGSRLDRPQSPATSSRYSCGESKDLEDADEPAPVGKDDADDTDTFDPPSYADETEEFVV